MFGYKIKSDLYVQDMHLRGYIKFTDQDESVDMIGMDVDILLLGKNCVKDVCRAASRAISKETIFNIPATVTFHQDQHIWITLDLTTEDKFTDSDIRGICKTMLRMVELAYKNQDNHGKIVIHDYDKPNRNKRNYARICHHC